MFLPKERHYGVGRSFNVGLKSWRGKDVLELLTAFISGGEYDNVCFYGIVFVPINDQTTFAEANLLRFLEMNASIFDFVEEVLREKEYLARRGFFGEALFRDQIVLFQWEFPSKVALDELRHPPTLEQRRIVN